VLDQREMRQTDVIIVGGGLAGSLAAAMLGRKGIATVLIDPHEVYPPELRCEKLDAGQVAILKKTGLAEFVLAQTAFARNLDVVRHDRVVDSKPGMQQGIMYHNLVNTLRAAIPPSVERIKGKVNAVATTPTLQTVTLSTGEEITGRLVVLSNGLNLGLRESLGMAREVISPTHSVTLGFDLKPVGRPSFDFEALTYYPRRPSEKAAYLTLFPVPGAMRANYIVYREMIDPWLARMRKEPHAALLEAIPRLEEVIGPFEVTGEVWIRPADLYQTRNVEQPGVVLAGDAFATSCPAGGTGPGKVFTDVERLCNRYVPEWLGSEGMGAEKVAAFYADPDKLAYDAYSRDRAFSLKATSIDPGLQWAARRWGKFALRALIGAARRLRTRATPAVAPGVEAHS
jgi:2-polyprenyl-6-methoxyphenol hydroxylase-like FAD-dependent oxidoreductase